MTSPRTDLVYRPLAELGYTRNMSKSAQALIETAFSRLRARAGFVERENQQQLAYLIHDCIHESKTGLFEAPTGLGKSLAGLIPAIACALAGKKRVVIATYTNVLAEQYWEKDLPLALELFDEVPKTAFLIGRQRYACLAAAETHERGLDRWLEASLKLGIETEFRASRFGQGKAGLETWKAILTPPVCEARLCHKYQPCFYYSARRQAEKAEIVITNHSVVLQDALLRRASGNDLNMLGKVDLILFDEAHDLISAAINALEFELSEAKLASMIALASKIESILFITAERIGARKSLYELCEGFRHQMAVTGRNLQAYQEGLGAPGILTAKPAEIADHPTVKPRLQLSRKEIAEAISHDVSVSIYTFTKDAQALLTGWHDDERIGEQEYTSLSESLRNYIVHMAEFGLGCSGVFDPHGSAVSYTDAKAEGARIRSDVLDLAPELREVLWERIPSVCMSATLALDGGFEFFKRVTGIQPDFEEILPTPFDFSSQAALYLPPTGRVPDPTTARKEGIEEEYFRLVAEELSEIIKLMGGRTLALFHSRREMTEVFSRMKLPESLPILVQRPTGVSSIGTKFRSDPATSLFALRSFWTGFDAPGETLSCVALVRIPFEVPIEPTQLARQAWMALDGLNPFANWTLPHAKMLMRQGAGRLIRRDSDVGLLAILDPRLQSKNYGEEILANLPEGMRAFRDIADAIGWLGIEPLVAGHQG